MVGVGRCHITSSAATTNHPPLKSFALCRKKIEEEASAAAQQKRGEGFFCQKGCFWVHGKRESPPPPRESKIEYSREFLRLLGSLSENLESAMPENSQDLSFPVRPSAWLFLFRKYFWSWKWVRRERGCCVRSVPLTNLTNPTLPVVGEWCKGFQF